MDDPGIRAAVRAALAAHAPATIDAEGRPLAAVLLALVPHPGEPHVLLTVRTDRVEHHKGEISFPGGAADRSDPDLRFTALRETHEEVGVAPEHVEVVGGLDHRVTRSGFHVTPYVGILDRAPYPYAANAREVAEILEVPLSHLLAPSSHASMTVERDGQLVEAPAYRWREHLIWGATAAILGGFLRLVAPRLEEAR